MKNYERKMYHRLFRNKIFGLRVDTPAKLGVFKLSQACGTPPRPENNAKIIKMPASDRKGCFIILLKEENSCFQISNLLLALLHFKILILLKIDIVFYAGNTGILYLS